MTVEKKVTISFTEEEKNLLGSLRHTIYTTVCEQYDSCTDCPFGLDVKGIDANGCTGQKFFNGLDSISDFK